MKKQIKQWMIGCMILVFLMSNMMQTTYGLEATSRDKLIASICTYQQKQVTDPSFGNAWLMLGMLRSDQTVPDSYKKIYYNNLISYCTSSSWKLTTTRYTDYSKMILALTSLGYDASDLSGHNLFDGLSDMKNIQKQGINGVIWALLALDSNYAYEIPQNSSASEQASKEKLVTAILKAKLSKGGWALSGSSADVDMTAMAVQALAPYYWLNTEATSAIDEALDILSNAQLKNGGFASSGTENAESAAQVIVALSALNIDCQQDTRFIKNGSTPLDALYRFRVSQKGFMHLTNTSINGMATEQGLYALVAYQRMVNYKSSLYDMSDLLVSSGEVSIDTATTSTTATTATKNTTATTATKNTAATTASSSKSTSTNKSSGSTSGSSSTVGSSRAASGASTGSTSSSGSTQSVSLDDDDDTDTIDDTDGLTDEEVLDDGWEFGEDGDYDDYGETTDYEEYDEMMEDVGRDPEKIDAVMLVLDTMAMGLAACLHMLWQNGKIQLLWGQLMVRRNAKNWKKK
jgi:hypothetical protein